MKGIFTVKKKKKTCQSTKASTIFHYNLSLQRDPHLKNQC